MPYSKTDTLIIGGGIAGIVTALELLDRGKHVTILERGQEEHLGGMAKWAFGGIFLVNSKQQRWGKIKDSVDLAWDDWVRTAEFEAEDHWPRAWAKHFVENCTEQVGGWMNRRGIGFFPIVHWVEKGTYFPGNSVPRFHMIWGTGWELSAKCLAHLKNHKNKDKLTILLGHTVKEILTQNGRVSGAHGVLTGTENEFSIEAEQTIIASGGIGGNLERIRRTWYKPWGPAPKFLINGAHPHSDGIVLDAAEKINARTTHMDLLWNYAAGIRHPKPHFPGHGLSLVPPKSALWMNYRGERMGPMPLVTGFDTRDLVERICKEPQGYTWQIMNYKIALKELAISGSEHNEAIRDKSILGFLGMVLRGNRKLVNHLMKDCPDFVTANSIEELTNKMNTLAGEQHINANFLRDEILRYDNMLARGRTFHNDDQIRRIAQSLKYRGDKARTCKFQRILDEKAFPLIAVREVICTRKTLGGIQTDLQSRALDLNGNPIPGLFAVGEAAGYGGGGMHGKKSLEGTFLGGCILTARRAAESISG